MLTEVLACGHTVEIQPDGGEGACPCIELPCSLNCGCEGTGYCDLEGRTITTAQVEEIMNRQRDPSLPRFTLRKEGE